MSSGPLPARVDAVRLFARHADMTGTIALERMPRLTEYLLDPEQSAPVDAELHFSRTENGQRLISGHLEGSFRMRCQRCLEPVAVELDTRLDLLVAGSESELTSIAAEQDALLCDEDEFDLLGALEDELILGLPLVPRHDNRDCSPLPSRHTGEVPDSARQSDAGDGPFAELEKLKGTLKKGTLKKDPGPDEQD